MKILNKIVIILITVVALIFAAQNFDTVEIVFLKWSVMLPIAVVVFAIYILGAFSGGMLRSLIKKVATMDQSKKNAESERKSDPVKEFNTDPKPKPKPGFFSDSDEQR